VNTLQAFYNEVDDALRIAPAAKSTNSNFNKIGADSEKATSTININNNLCSFDLVAGIGVIIALLKK